MEKIYTEYEMEQELTNRGHNILDEDGCTDSVEVVDLAVSLYGFNSTLNEDEMLEFTGDFGEQKEIIGGKENV